MTVDRYRPSRWTTMIRHAQQALVRAWRERSAGPHITAPLRASCRALRLIRPLGCATGHGHARAATVAPARTLAVAAAKSAKAHWRRHINSACGRCIGRHAGCARGGGGGSGTRARGLETRHALPGVRAAAGGFPFDVLMRRRIVVDIRLAPRMVRAGSRWPRKINPGGPRLQADLCAVSPAALPRDANL